MQLKLNSRNTFYYSMNCLGIKPLDLILLVPRVTVLLAEMFNSIYIYIYTHINSIVYIPKIMTL